MDGILLVDKPSGITSHDVVDIVRRRFAQRKVGHAGTLDPAATGLLVILLGAYTKRSAEFMAGEKGYRAVMVLGATSDTGDGDGTITPSRTGPIELSPRDVEAALEEFTGEIAQVPPMYSAVRHGGTKLYELARRGVEVARSPRPVTIRVLTMVEYAPPRVTLEVICSKGTYIRQLCVDIGAKLSCGAYCGELRRLSSGGFSVERSVPFDTLTSAPREELATMVVRA